MTSDIVYISSAVCDLRSEVASSYLALWIPVNMFYIGICFVGTVVFGIGLFPIFVWD